MMWFDDQFENTFRRMSNRFFNTGDIFENPNGNQVHTCGPHYYGYQITVGPDGKPRVKEWGNVRPTSASSLANDAGAKKPYVDETLNEKEKTLHLVTEMPGIEKSDIQVNVFDGIVSICAGHDDRKYDVKIPLKYKVDEDSAKAKYKNGILELTFALAEERIKGRVVSVE